MRRDHVFESCAGRLALRPIPEIEFFLLFRRSQGWEAERGDAITVVNILQDQNPPFDGLKGDLEVLFQVVEGKDRTDAGRKEVNEEVELRDLFNVLEAD